MLWVLGGILSALGLYIFLSRAHLSSWLVGAQLIFLSLATFFVQSGMIRGQADEAQVGAMNVILIGSIFTSVLLGLSVRKFMLNRHVRADETEAE